MLSKTSNGHQTKTDYVIDTTLTEAKNADLCFLGIRTSDETAILPKLELGAGAELKTYLKMWGGGKGKAYMSGEVLR